MKRSVEVLVATLALLRAPLLVQAGPLVTSEIIYSPAHMRVTATVSGSCWEPSIAVDRRDAFRCMSGGRILDPCFVRNANAVYCLEDLIADRGTAVTLTKPLPPPSASANDQPWAMRLQSGGFCKIGTGTIVPGFPFSCSDDVCGAPYSAEVSRAQFALCGRPSRPGLIVEHPIARFVRTLWK